MGAVTVDYAPSGVSAGVCLEIRVFNANTAHGRIDQAQNAPCAADIRRD